MSIHNKPTPWDVVRAVEILRDMGFCMLLPNNAIGNKLKQVTVDEASEIVNFSKSWVRAHMEEFPNASRAPGGDVRIPISDIEAALDRWRKVYQSGKSSEIAAA